MAAMIRNPNGFSASREQQRALAHGLHRALAKVDGVRNLAILLGLTRQAVEAWKKVPAARVHDVERVTSVPRHQLRPDLYPPEREIRGTDQMAPFEAGRPMRPR